MTEDKINISCDIIKDLMPLCCDNAASDATKAAVEEHLQGCEECSEEYRLMCADLDLDLNIKDKSGKRSSVVSFLKSLRKKAVIKGIVITAAAVAVLGGVLYVLLDLPIKPLDRDKIEVMRTYKTDDTLYVYYKNEWVQRQFGDADFDEENKQLKLDIKAPVIQYRSDFPEFDDIWTISLGDFDCETVTLNGEVIWSAEKNADDKIPEYVYEYIEFKQADDGRGWFADDNTQGVTYADGTMKVWNMDGDLIYSGKSEDYEGYEN